MTCTGWLNHIVWHLGKLAPPENRAELKSSTTGDVSLAICVSFFHSAARTVSGYQKVGVQKFHVMQIPSWCATQRWPGWVLQSTTQVQLPASSRNETEQCSHMFINIVPQGFELERRNTNFNKVTNNRTTLEYKFHEFAKTENSFRAKGNLENLCVSCALGIWPRVSISSEVRILGISLGIKSVIVVDKFTLGDAVLWLFGHVILLCLILDRFWKIHTYVVFQHLTIWLPSLNCKKKLFFSGLYILDPYLNAIIPGLAM